MFKKIVGLGFPSHGKNKTDIQQHISELVDSGAGEFFTGYNPSYWSDKFGFEVSPNGRFAEHEQITDIETLREVVSSVHGHRLEIFANLNAWYYSDETFPYIERMYQEFCDIWVDGIICGNIGILEYLKEKNYCGKINISTILAVYNSEALRFFLENYSINKVILSREVTLREIEKLVTSFPQTQFEVFGEGDFCRYNNGLCFAEHKYGAKDICTVVVNDLVIHKVFRADFKRIILDENISEQAKLQKFDERYQDIFSQIEEIFQRLLLGDISDTSARELLEKILLSHIKRVDLFFDAQKPLQDEKNQRILTFLKALRFVNESWNQNIALWDIQKELETSIKTGLLYISESIQKNWGFQKIRALQLASFYAKSDRLNLYSYLFFSRFPNIETVKFPTRGRNYGEKIALIQQVLEAWNIDWELLDRGISIERAHYDLTYLFGDTLWFRKLLQEMK